MTNLALISEHHLGFCVVAKSGYGDAYAMLKGLRSQFRSLLILARLLKGLCVEHVDEKDDEDDDELRRCSNPTI